MNEIQWKAFALIGRALGILLFHLVGKENYFVTNWEGDFISFIEGRKDR